jgi:hypothetical protein
MQSLPVRGQVAAEVSNDVMAAAGGRMYFLKGWCTDSPFPWLELAFTQDAKD